MYVDTDSVVSSRVQQFQRDQNTMNCATFQCYYSIPFDGRAHVSGMSGGAPLPAECHRLLEVSWLPLLPAGVRSLSSFEGGPAACGVPSFTRGLVVTPAACRGQVIVIV